MLFYVGSAFLTVLGIYCWSEIKIVYQKQEKTLPTHISIAIWASDTIHGLLVALASIYSVWQLPFNKMVALICGLIMFGVGLIIMLAGIMKFHSLRKISGMDTSRIITSGL